MERLHPGVYVEEISSGVRPIEGVSTSTAGFIGRAEKGPVSKPVLITSFAEFQSSHGTFLSDSYVAHAVFQFFNNGGKKCYIVRVAGSGAKAAAIGINDRRGTPAKTLTIRAANEGLWGNKLQVAITEASGDPQNEFAIRVFLDRSDALPPLAPFPLETHDNLSINPAAKNFVEKVVGANSKYIVAQTDPADLANAGAGTSRSGSLTVGNGAVELKLGPNGGTETAGAAGPPATAGTSRSADNPSTNPPADKRGLVINIDGDGDRGVFIPIEAATGPDIAAAIEAAVRNLQAITPANQVGYSGFTCIFDTSGANPAYLLTSGSKGAASTVVAKDLTVDPFPAGKFSIAINGDGPHLVSLGATTTGTALATAIQNAVTALTANRSANQPAFAGFTCVYDPAANTGNPSLLLTSGTAGVGSSVRVTDAPNKAENIAKTLKLGATNGGRERNGEAVLRPANSLLPNTQYLLGIANQAAANVAAGSIVAGNDGATLGDQDYVAALSALDTVTDVNILAIPGIYTVVDDGTNYCTQRGDCFFVGDVIDNADTVDEARDFVNGLTVKSSYGAIYFPWLKMTDPTGQSVDPIAVPPSGFVAGMYARIDAKRGVFKAPAGTEANLGGARALFADITDAQQDFLNPLGVNVIRSFAASGLVIWGARTLATRSDPEYRYIPVRRTAIFLERSIYNGIQWAVFEPNDEDLWASLRLNIGAFMTLQFQAGAFQGRTPSEAFFVDVSDKTTTQADIDAGIVNILVGFAPLKPAEFIVLKLSQKAGQPAA